MMTYYGLLLPEATLLFGILITLVSDIFSHDDDPRDQWTLQLVILLLATFQQLLIYRVGTTIFLRGGMVLDGLSQLLSITILLMSLIMHLNRRTERRILTSQSHILCLGLALFALCSVQVNRFLFGVFAIVGAIWICQAALASESKRLQQTVIVQSGILRGIIYFFIGVCLCIVCIAAFGETQIDEIQRIISRPNIPQSLIYFTEITILFLGALIMGIPPFHALWGRSRQSASWSLSIGSTGILSVVGLSIFLRWAILVFSRVAVGRQELEPISQIDIFSYLRVIAIVALVLIPLMALLSQKFRQGILLFALNPFAQILFAISFAQKEIMGFAVGYIILSIFTLGVLIYAIRSLKLAEDFSLASWVGIGRRALIPTLVLISALTSLAGLAPFFGSIVLQKTLCIKSFSGFALLLNVALSGYYVVRLAELAFQGGHTVEFINTPLSKMQKFWFVSQFMILIFMGIFWQPLYKYGAYSIRGLFGEI
jgi:hypothetical protein